MLDFSNCEKNPFRFYGGKNGDKIGIYYGDQLYMLKFPPSKEVFEEKRYTNSCISEYISCHIFNLLGISAQETLLGLYKTNGKSYVTVACKDFTDHTKVFSEFAHIKNSCIESSGEGYGTELESIYEAIKEQDLIDEAILTGFFWDMFIVDAYIGNFDRHNGNWGFLIDEANHGAEIAPIFDCGSSLFPQLKMEEMEHILATPDEVKSRVYVFPNSALRIAGKKIKYFSFISSLENPDCNAALKRIVPRIEQREADIFNMIDEIDCISSVEKNFYKTMLAERKEKILAYSYKRLEQGAVQGK